jgi:hypothetical protein
MPYIHDTTNYAPYDHDLSLDLDEVIAMLDVARPGPFRTMLECRKANLEHKAFGTQPKIAPDRARCDPETWAIIRRGVLQRDSFRCQGCGLAGTRADVHHIVPVDAGRSDDPSNLITLCRDCHTKIHPWLMADEQRPCAA